MTRASAFKPRWVFEPSKTPDGQFQIRLLEYKTFQSRYDELACITGRTEQECKDAFNTWYRNYCILRGKNPDAAPFDGERLIENFNKKQEQ